MRYLILSDLHANLAAFDAVLADAGQIGYDEALVLGDLVGYGGDPAAVIERTLALRPAAMIRGNHDKVCAGIESAEFFNDSARAAIEWTAATLEASHLAILAALPRGPRLIDPDIEICHGAPFDEDFYVFDEDDAVRAVETTSARVCFFGHTHVPAIFSSPMDPVRPAAESDDEWHLGRQPVLINVGSVGQPRDGDNRAAYGLYDTDRNVVRFRRVPYDVEAAQASILRAGLPAWLADRLARGQ